MKEIYSQIDPDILLAIIVPFQDFNKPRTEIVPDTEFLQGAAIRCNEGDKFRPHKHIWKVPINHYSISEVLTQECWLVFRGVINAVVYDINDTPIASVVLKEGDAIFLLHGGHAFSCLEDHTCLWEVKNGPYEGQAKDKIFINLNG
jgi:hypothetical protein